MSNQEFGPHIDIVVKKVPKSPQIATNCTRLCWCVLELRRMRRFFRPPREPFGGRMPGVGLATVPRRQVGGQPE